ncbi:MAG: N-acetylmuramic acid 6-phosphate etherase [Candidatus Omnitrophica bacterium]|nr:N-acetylmuramic acid 6-phosphate etherase [Candidatus Omnitrophota bacterium]
MPRATSYATLPTEQPNPRTRALDRLSVERILRLMNREDARVPRALAGVIPQIASAVSLIVAALREGGRLRFLGAGTSGRLGVIEAAECPPTFHTPPELVQAIIAGGRGAVSRSREGAEDDRARARQEIRRRVRAGDVVVGIAASGVTPFVVAGLHTAKTRGASTILVTCHAHLKARTFADVCISPSVGPEVIAGSTRLKAATATKLILNMLTVAAMVRLGKVYGNLMVDVRPTSRKLKARALRIIRTVAGVSPRQAAAALRRARGDTKTAIVMAVRRLDASTARTLLRHSEGDLRQLLMRGGSG